MTIPLAIEMLAGLALVAAGAVHYFGWPPVALTYGVVLVTGAGVQLGISFRRRRPPRGY